MPQPRLHAFAFVLSDGVARTWYAQTRGIALAYAEAWAVERGLEVKDGK